MTDMLELPDLTKEIREGSLLLRGDRLSRFSFSVESYPIGIYAIRSIGVNAVSIIRRWDQEKEVQDPISNLIVMNQGRQFDRLQIGRPMFLVEFTSDFGAVVSKVAFRSNSVRLFNAVLPGAPEYMRFESAELRGVEILG